MFYFKIFRILFLYDFFCFNQFLKLSLTEKTLFLIMFPKETSLMKKTQFEKHCNRQIGE